MKKNQIKISYYYIIIYLLFILIPFHFNKYLKNNAIETIEIDLMKKKYNIFKYEDYKEGEPKKRINDKEREKDPDDDDDEMSDEIKELIDKIDDLNRKIDITKTDITKNKIYMVFFSILDTILFLIIIIYTSVKCFVLCTKKIAPVYRISDISSNKNEDDNYDENGEEKINKNSNNLEDFDAPVHASIKYNNKKYNTFDPDNYRPSNEDKELYKPYKDEDIL